MSRKYIEIDGEWKPILTEKEVGEQALGALLMVGAVAGVALVGWGLWEGGKWVWEKVSS